MVFVRFHLYINKPLDRLVRTSLPLDESASRFQVKEALGRIIIEARQINVLELIYLSGKFFRLLSGLIFFKKNLEITPPLAS